MRCYYKTHFKVVTWTACKVYAIFSYTVPQQFNPRNVRRALRRLHSVGGSAPVNLSRRRRRTPGPKKLAAARRSLLMLNTCFKSASAEILCYKDMHVQTLFFAVS